MTIYRLAVPDRLYDTIHAVVVRAVSEGEARDLVAASNRADSEYFAREATCQAISTDGAAEILCVDVLEG